MDEEVLESYIRQYIESQQGQECHFAWQGGEPTLLGIDYFRSLISLQKKYAAGRKIINTIQTNGTLLTDDWCRLFKENGFLVGLSIDGPRELHDTYRLGRNGQATFDAVMAGLSLLRKHEVSYNTLTVVNDCNSRQPLEVYRFLKTIGDGYMQFIPAVERQPDSISRQLGLHLAIPPSAEYTSRKTSLTAWSVSPDQLAGFYIALFDEWVRNDVGRVFVQFFDVALGNWLGAGSGLCQFSPECGMAGALEHNGDLYSCDHYVYPEHKLGNIMEIPLPKLMVTEKQQRFRSTKLNRLAEDCKECNVRSLCHGDCPKHRFVDSRNGSYQVSYLCTAYKKIFSHMAPYLDIMARLIHYRRPVPEIMGLLHSQATGESKPAPGRNAPCCCGSGRKYKRCCGR